MPRRCIPGFGRFEGFELRHYTGLQANSILGAVSTSGPDSNLQAGTNMVSDVEMIQFEKFRPEGENYSLKVLFKMAVNYGLGATG